MNNNASDLKDISNLIADKLTKYLSDSQQGKGKVLIQKPAVELAKTLELKKWIKNGGFDVNSASGFLDNYLANTQHLHHPNYIGHQVCPPHIASGLADFIHGIVNNPMSIYEMGPAAAVIEKFLLNWMLDKIGWFKGDDLDDFRVIEENGGGILTHGGSLANLTALLAARANIDANAWTEGVGNDLVILVPEEAHYSIARSISIMGMGSTSLIEIPTSSNKVMLPEELSPVYKKIESQGKRVMAVVANACTTATGLYDPLDEIGDFCNENNLWYHIDAAHGASALLSKKEKHLLKGIDKADSVIWDAHKMLRTSALCAAVLFKDYITLNTIFQQKGSYLFHDKEQVGFDTMAYTVECTKAGIGTKLFWVLAAEGENGLSKYIERTYDSTKLFYELISASKDFECPYRPESNILCFRYIKYHSNNNEYQLEIRNKLVKDGNFYITSTELNNIRYLRLTVINELTTNTTIKNLLAEISRIAEELKSNF